jgi:8-oxo-dGTP pyrophosphatase MutT (NUDIX family)
MTRHDLGWIREQLAGRDPHAISDAEAPRHAAVAIILRAEAQAAAVPNDAACCEILFIRRSTHADDPWSGQMAFPGGRVETEDASPLAAARRETREEVGLELERDATLLGRLDDVRASARGRLLPMAIAPFVFHLTGASETRCNDEVEESLWVPTATLLDPATAGTVPYELGGHRFELPAFVVDGRIIWGLTYQMLMLFFGILGWELSPRH